MGLPSVGEDAAAAFLGSEGAAAAPPAADAASTSTLVADTSEQESPSAQGSTALGAVNGTIVTVNASEMAAMLRRATTLVSAPVEPTMSNHSSGSGMAVGDAFYTKVAVLSQSELFHTRTGVTISVPPGLTCVALQATVTPAWCLSTCAVTTTWIPECPGKCKCEDKGLPPPPGLA